MKSRLASGRWSGAIVALLGPSLLAWSVQASHDPSSDLLQQARNLERDGRWDQACDIYEHILARHGKVEPIKEQYQNCLRHAQEMRRHRDASFKDQLLNQEISIALKLYGEVLAKLQANYVEKEKVELSRLFQQGLEELRLALEDEIFRQEHLPAATLKEVSAFQHHLIKTWGRVSVHRHSELQTLALQVGLEAQKRLHMRPVVTVLELVCGACNGLDEHTAFLTPAQLTDAFTSIDGEFASVGIEVEWVNGKLAISQIIPRSPAALEGLKVGDWISRINKRPVNPLVADVEISKLRGAPGTHLELEIMPTGESDVRKVRLIRQTLIIPSVFQAQLLDEQAGIGYCQLANFQKTTVQELEEALLSLKMRGLRALILDLRGNPGGLFHSAIDVVEHFLANGVIVSTQGQAPEQNRIYRATNPGALAIPLVVLVDGETASAAEVVAGALKDNQRATLVGQPTFGKGTIQRVLQFKTVRSGIRVTSARFFSPRGVALSGNGVTPHIAVERLPMSMMDRSLEVAIQEAGRLVIIQQ